MSQRKRIVVAVVLAFAATAAIAEPLPVPKPSGLGGSPPAGLHDRRAFLRSNRLEGDFHGGC